MLTFLYTRLDSPGFSPPTLSTMGVTVQGVGAKFVLRLHSVLANRVIYLALADAGVEVVLTCLAPPDDLFLTATSVEGESGAVIPLPSIDGIPRVLTATEWAVTRELGDAQPSPPRREPILKPAEVLSGFANSTPPAFRVTFRLTVDSVATASVKSVWLSYADSEVVLTVIRALDGHTVTAVLPTSLIGRTLNFLVIDSGTGRAGIWSFQLERESLVDLDIASAYSGALVLEDLDPPANPFYNVASGLRLASPTFQLPPLRRITVRTLRNGEKTLGPKQVKVYQDAAGVNLMAYFGLLRDGYEETQTFSQAFDGERFLQGVDTQEPRIGTLRWPVINQDVTLLLNFSDDEGSSNAGGQPAVMDARVAVSGLPAIRDVVAVERLDDGVWRVSGHGISNSDGEALISLKALPSSQIYALTVDDWGTPFQPLLEVAVGATVRPTFYGGWLYLITEAGTLPDVEPEWWPVEGDNVSRAIGTARAIAVRYHQPLAHGPVNVEFT